MDSQDRRNAVSSLVGILRKVTRIVQLLPFAYLLLLSAYLFLEFLLPEWALRIADNALNAPVYSIVGMLGAGRLLKLCRWFRTACLLPMATKVESWIDSFVITFTQNEIVIINTILGLLFLSFIILACRHFSHGRKAAAV